MSFVLVTANLDICVGEERGGGGMEMGGWRGGDGDGDGDGEMWRGKGEGGKGKEGSERNRRRRRIFQWPLGSIYMYTQ